MWCFCWAVLGSSRVSWLRKAQKFRACDSDIVCKKKMLDVSRVAMIYLHNWLPGWVEYPTLWLIEAISFWVDSLYTGQKCMTYFHDGMTFGKYGIVQRWGLPKFHFFSSFSLLFDGISSSWFLIFSIFRHSNMEVSTKNMGIPMVFLLIITQHLGCGVPLGYPHDLGTPLKELRTSPLEAPMLQDVLHYKVSEGMSTELWSPG